MTPHDLIARFDELAEAPDAPSILRALILRIAVEGRLVPQVAGEGDAAALLQALHPPVSSGTSTRGRARAENAEVRCLHEIPSSWQWARFDHVAVIASNLVAPSTWPDAPHVAPDNIEKRTGRLLPYRTVREDGVTSNKHRFFSGQILYSKIRPNLSKAVLVDFDGLCSADMYPLRPLIDRGYLHLYILSQPFLDVVTADDNRLAMPKVNQEQLSAVPVPVPPLAEQKRIVARVDELMKLIDQLDAAHTRREQARVAFRDSALSALQAATTTEEVELAWARVRERFDDVGARAEDLRETERATQELLVRGHLSRGHPAALEPELQDIASRRGTRFTPPEGPPFQLPTGWIWCAVEDCCDVGGGLQKSGKRQGGGAPIPYLRVANVQRGALDLREIAKFDVTSGELERCRLVPGDILVVEGNGSETEIGRCARWHGEIEVCVHQNHLIRCRPLIKGIEHFILMYLNSPSGIAVMKSLAVTTSGLFNLSVGKIKKILVPLPPLATQAELVALSELLQGSVRSASEAVEEEAASLGRFAAAAVHHLDA